MSCALSINRFGARSMLSQMPLLALGVSLAAYGPLLQSARSRPQPLPTATLQQLKAGFDPLGALNKAGGATGRFLGRNLRAIGGMVSIGVGAVGALNGAAYGLAGLMIGNVFGGTVLGIGGTALAIGGGILGVTGLGLMGLGGWLIYRNFAGRKGN